MSDDKETGITHLEYKEWLRSKVSKFFIENLTARRDARVAELLSGALLDPANPVTVEYALGYIAGQNVFLDTKFDDNAKSVSSYGH